MAAEDTTMSLFIIVQALIFMAAVAVAAMLVLHLYGYRLEIRLKPTKGRRRRPVEPDEHTLFF